MVAGVTALRYACQVSVLVIRIVQIVTPVVVSVRNALAAVACQVLCANTMREIMKLHQTQCPDHLAHSPRNGPTVTGSFRLHRLSGITARRWRLTLVWRRPKHRPLKASVKRRSIKQHWRLFSHLLQCWLWLPLLFSSFEHGRNKAISVYFVYTINYSRHKCHLHQMDTVLTRTIFCGPAQT